MSELKGKIDFTLFVSADNANPNGDPLNGNRPRINMDGHGEISDVCIKRKIRNRQNSATIPVPYKTTNFANIALYRLVTPSNI